MLKRTLGLGALITIAMGGVGVASIATSTSQERDDGRPPTDLRADASTVAFRGTAADPGGQPRWVLRTHRTRADKLLCFEVGQQVPGEGFGRVERGGFAPRERGPDGGPAGSCVDLRKEPNPLIIVTEFDSASGDGGRTLITGLLSDFTEVLATGPGTETRTIQPGDDGTFLTVYEGDVLDELVVDYVTADGRLERKK